MKHALILDDDPSIVMSAQKLFVKDTEWLATLDLTKALELVDLF